MDDDKKRIPELPDTVKNQVSEWPMISGEDMLRIYSGEPTTRPFTLEQLDLHYRELLIKYMAHIYDNEGIDYIDHESWIGVNFTEQEKKELIQLSQEARDKYL